MNYLDANFIVALHFNIPSQTSIAEKFVRKASAPFVVSSLAELECRRAFNMVTGDTQSENWRRFKGKLDAGEWIRLPVPWERAAEKASELMDKYGTQFRAGTLDTLHIALALLAGCTWFLSFDSHSNARVLAASARLKIYPELSPEERGKVAP